MVSPSFGMLLTPSDDSELCCTLQYIYSQTVVGKIMATEKTTTLTFASSPTSKKRYALLPTETTDPLPTWLR